MKITYDKQHNSLIIQSDTTPDWDEFEQWGKNLLSQLDNYQFNQLDTGADRHKLTFTFELNRFSLNYETYTDGCWIEIDEPNAKEGLEQLKVQLKVRLEVQ